MTPSREPLWHIETNVSGSWKPELRARAFLEEDAKREASRLNRIAAVKGVAWQYRAAPDNALSPERQD